MKKDTGQGLRCLETEAAESVIGGAGNTTAGTAVQTLISSPQRLAGPGVRDQGLEPDVVEHVPNKTIPQLNLTEQLIPFATVGTR